MVAPSISRRFDAGNVGEFEEAIWRNFDIEAPLFGLTRFEVGEVGGVNRIDQDVVRRREQALVRAGQLFAERFEL